MSIQSEITRITNEVSTQTDLIAQIATALSGKTSGGGGSDGIPLPSTITAGDTPVLFCKADGLIYGTSAQASGQYVIIQRAGTYRFKYSAFRFTTTSGTFKTWIYKNGAVVSGTEKSIPSGEYAVDMSFDVACVAGDRIEIYGSSRSSSYGLVVPHLIASINWDTGF